MLTTSFKDGLASSASFCTILQFLAGILVCRRFIKNGTTGDTSGLAFISCFMSCSNWLCYGLLIHDSFIVLVNVFGATLQLFYVITFMLYSVKKSTILKQLIGSITFVTFVFTYSMLEPNRALAAQRIGFLSCSTTIFFFASPLTMLAYVIRIKSAESLPFPIIISSLICCCQWFAYGCIQKDLFIQLPNFLGIALSMFQVSLFFIYPGKKVDQVHFI
ncbi:sugar transporter SWEET1 [Leptopilina heterotoma]|uniref:sugar transporter SWEET1 n=1 Tax=Leptopilina heterotoma TaxID=63436 RepID=UPI001CA98860|nr:sugar transporter SWEET1 [Leptopilina heterotoma]